MAGLALSMFATAIPTVLNTVHDGAQMLEIFGTGSCSTNLLLVVCTRAENEMETEKQWRDEDNYRCVIESHWIDHTHTRTSHCHVANNITNATSAQATRQNLVYMMSKHIIVKCLKAICAR